MSKLAFIFPGQGAQYVGMGKDIVENNQVAQEVFEEASEAIGVDMKKMCFEGPEEYLKKTENTQPAILTTCIAITKILTEKGIQPDITVGLSLGEYASLVIAGVIDFKDAVRLVKKRGKYMQETVPFGVGTMAAIIGTEREELYNAIEKSKKYGIVEVANINSPRQIVISGEVGAIENLCQTLNQKGNLRAITLTVSAPFHSSMLIPAGQKLSNELENIVIKDFDLPVITNVTADYYKDKTEVKDMLVKQISSSVLWEESIERMINDGVNTFIEIGPGKSLSSFVRIIAHRVKENVKILNIQNIKDLNKVIETIHSI